MARFAVDASTLLAFLLNEERTAAVRGFWAQLTRDDQVVGPSLLLAECTSNIRTAVDTGRVPADEGPMLVSQLLHLPVRLNASVDQFRIAYEFATRLRRRKAYDMHYLAVARLEDAEVITVDGGMRQSAVELGIPVRLLR